MNTIYGMLLVDWYERKTKNWPLHKYGESSPLRVKIADLSCLVAGSYDVMRREHSLDVVKEKIAENWPFAKWILNTYRGEVILAGGAVCRPILHSRNVKSDADFFFVGCSKERIDQILREVHTHFGIHGRHFVALRNSKTTTFCVTNSERERNHIENYFESKYQFIHSRSYATAASVIGGFDLTVAACYYDGEDIWMTTMCSFSLVHRINILDPSRRSTTYESRLRKYATAGARIVFPFANLQEIIKHCREKAGGLLEQKVRFEIVKGLDIWVPSDFGSGAGVAIATSEHKNPQSVGDYGPDALGLRSLRLFNGVLANRGDLDGLTWYGTEISHVFDQPDIQVDYPHYFEIGKKDRNLRAADLTMWLGKEETFKIITSCSVVSLKSSNHGVCACGDCGGKSGGILQVWKEKIPLIKRKVKLAIRKVEMDVEANGVQYIGPNENPGRQHTASFNPVYGNVRDYYTPVWRDIMTIGVSHETYWVLKLAMGKTYQKDTHNYILRLLVESLAKSVMKSVFKPKKQPKPEVIRQTRKIVRPKKIVEESDSDE